MFTGTAVFDMLLPGDSRSLKAKRSYVRPIVAALRKLEVSSAEVGDCDVHGRTQVGVAVVSGEHSHVQDVLDACEKLVAGRPEIELLSVRRRVFGPEDEEEVWKP
ncbi:MAG: DUF503 domain-containing protein [Stackebrandtia sp.]